MAKKVRLIEVGLRDGLQNESKLLTVDERLQILKGLIEAGHREIELGAFVSPKWVPQMAGTAELVAQALKAYPLKKGHEFTVLVPNDKGYDGAKPTGLKEIAVFLACTESFSQKNINCSIEESFERYASVIARAKKDKILVRGYLSVCFGCPYEGDVAPNKVVKLAERLLKMGVYEVSFGDTIGVANPKQVQALIRKLHNKFKGSQIAMHFHDTRGTALANTLASIQEGVMSFDSSIGGLGGCPYAPGSLGNVATEDMVYMIHGMGLDTGLNLRRLVELNKQIVKMMGKELPSRVGALSPEKFQGR
jgi:hydroxymethylglutaryl-CoA lyase